MSGRKGLYIRISDSSRDRVIDTWLDSIKENKDIKVSELVKDFLYSVATGGQNDDPALDAIIKVIRSEFARLPAMIRIQGSMNDETTAAPDDADEIARRLGEMLD